jgi:hypothetical protein
MTEIMTLNLGPVYNQSNQQNLNLLPKLGFILRIIVRTQPMQTYFIKVVETINLFTFHGSITCLENQWM